MSRDRWRTTASRSTDDDEAEAEQLTEGDHHGDEAGGQALEAAEQVGGELRRGAAEEVAGQCGDHEGDSCHDEAQETSAGDRSTAALGMRSRPAAWPR